MKPNTCIQGLVHGIFQASSYLRRGLKDVRISESLSQLALDISSIATERTDHKVIKLASWSKRLTARLVF